MRLSTVKELLQKFWNEDNPNITLFMATFYQVILLTALVYFSFIVGEMPLKFFLMFFGMSFVINYSIYKCLAKTEALLLALFAVVWSILFLTTPCYLLVELMTLIGLSPITFFIRQIFLPLEIMKVTSRYGYRSSLFFLIIIHVFAIVFELNFPPEASYIQDIFGLPFPYK